MQKAGVMAGELKLSLAVKAQVGYGYQLFRIDSEYFASDFSLAL